MPAIAASPSSRPSRTWPLVVTIFAGLPVRPSHVFELASRACCWRRRSRLRFLLELGSEAVDTAPKPRRLSQGFQVRAHAPVSSRERGYHGIGFGVSSAGGMAPTAKVRQHVPTGVDHLQTIYDRSKQAFTKGGLGGGAHLADELTASSTCTTLYHCSESSPSRWRGRLASLPPPKGYLKKLREITAQHGILLIFDEVITGRPPGPLLHRALRATSPPTGSRSPSASPMRRCRWPGPWRPKKIWPTPS